MIYFIYTIYEICDFLFMKYSICFLFYLWNIISMVLSSMQSIFCLIYKIYLKNPVYDFFYLWNIPSFICVIYEITDLFISKIFHRWLFHLWNILSIWNIVTLIVLSMKYRNFDCFIYEITLIVISMKYRNFDCFIYEIS